MKSTPLTIDLLNFILMVQSHYRHERDKKLFYGVENYDPYWNTMLYFNDISADILNRFNLSANKDSYEKVLYFHVTDEMKKVSSDDLPKLFMFHGEQGEYELTKKALRLALRNFDPETIIEITENQEGGWGNGTEILNTASLDVIKAVLDTMCANCTKVIKTPLKKSNASFCDIKCHDSWYERGEIV